MLTMAFVLQAKASQFSLECHRSGASYYLTFDDQTERIVIEAVIPRGSPPFTAWKGLLRSITAHGIQFELLDRNPYMPKVAMFWSRQSGTISMPTSSAPWPWADGCAPTDLRPSLSLYDSIDP